MNNSPEAALIRAAMEAQVERETPRLTPGADATATIRTELTIVAVAEYAAKLRLALLHERRCVLADRLAAELRELERSLHLALPEIP